MSIAAPIAGLQASLSDAAQQAQTSIAARTALWTKLVDTGGNLAVNIGVAIVILLATIWLARWAAHLTREGFGQFNRRHAADPTLQIFFASVVRNVVIVIGLVAVLQQLGVRTTSIIAVLGAASLAVGLALQGALANVAAGVMLLLFRPYRVGERVQIAGKDGTVRSLDLFTTELTDPDHVRVVVPNGKAFGEVITNYSRLPNRRIEIKVGIDYEDDLDRALELLLSCARSDERVLGDPPPWAKLTALEPSSVTVTLRCWVRPNDWWDARFDLLRRIKECFDGAGLHFPYPHQVAVERDQAMAPLDVPVRRPEPAPSRQ